MSTDAIRERYVTLTSDGKRVLIDLRTGPGPIALMRVGLLV